MFAKILLALIACLLRKETKMEKLFWKTKEKLDQLSGYWMGYFPMHEVDCLSTLSLVNIHLACWNLSLSMFAMRTNPVLNLCHLCNLTFSSNRTSCRHSMDLIRKVPMEIASTPLFMTRRIRGAIVLWLLTIFQATSMGTTSSPFKNCRNYLWDLVFPIASLEKQTSRFGGGSISSSTS